MLFPIFLGALIGSVTVLGYKKAIDAYPVNDEALDLNTHAKIILDTAESELNTARSSARYALQKVDYSRRRCGKDRWSGLPMSPLSFMFMPAVSLAGVFPIQ